VFVQSGIPARAVDTPANAHVVGCNWPVAFQLQVPGSWRTGFYVVIVRVRDDDGGGVRA